jgi:hypothetical protein
VRSFIGAVCLISPQHHRLLIRWARTMRENGCNGSDASLDLDIALQNFSHKLGKIDAALHGFPGEVFPHILSMESGISTLVKLS